MPMVTRFGRKAPIGLLLTAVGSLKLGFGALIVTFWATIQITGETALEWRLADLGLFSPVFRAVTSEKKLATLCMSIAQ